MKEEITTRKADLKTLNFLQDLYELTKNDYVYFPLKDFTEKHRISSIKSTMVIKNKIIVRRKIKETGGRYEYKWNTIKPNIKMAQKINYIQYTEYLSKKKIDLFKQPLIVDTNKTIQEEKVTRSKKSTHREKKVDNIEKGKIEVKQQKEFSLFWGLIKIKY